MAYKQTVNSSDIFIGISEDAARIANEDPRLVDVVWEGSIFTPSNNPSKFAIDYNQRDISSILIAQGDNDQLDTIFPLLDQIAYDAISQAVQANLQNPNGVLLSLLLDKMRNG
jgi:hypothetical protein